MQNTIIFNKITKATFSLLSFITSALLVLPSCQKVVEKNEPIVSFRSTFPLNDTPLETLVKNPKDAEDEYISREHIKIARIVASLVPDKEFSKFCLETAKKNEGEISYEQIFTQFPQYKALFVNTAIAKRFGLGGVVSSSNSSSADYDFVHNGFGYQSHLFVPNYDNPSLAGQFAVSPAIEIRDDLQNNNHDIIFAWEVPSSNSLVEVQIGEKDALNTTKPILTTSLKTIVELNGANSNIVNSRFIESDRPNGLETRAVTACNTWKFQMNVHYENHSGTNEIYGAGHQYWSGSFPGSPAIRGLAGRPVANGDVNNNFHLAEISYGETGPGQNGKGLIITREKGLLDFVNPTFTHVAYYNTFERDWYSSPKPLGNYRFPNNQLFEISGRRVYYEEWLSFNPGPNLGRDTRGTLSNLRNVFIPLFTIRNRGEFIDASDQGKGETEFIKRN